MVVAALVAVRGERRILVVVAEEPVVGPVRQAFLERDEEQRSRCGRQT